MTSVVATRAQGILEKYVAILSKAGYLANVKTAAELGLNAELHVALPAPVPDHHPLVVLGACLPVDFRKLIDKHIFERSPEQKAKWYDTIGKTLRGPRAWGSLQGNIYRDVRGQLVLHDAMGFCLTRTISNLFIPEIVSLVGEYFVGPVGTLSEMVNELGSNATEFFPGRGYSYSYPDMFLAEDRLMFDSLAPAAKMVRRFQTMIHSHETPATLLSLSPRELEIQLVSESMRQEQYGNCEQFRADWAELYPLVKITCDACTVLYTQPTHTLPFF